MEGCKARGFIRAGSRIQSGAGEHSILEGSLVVGGIPAYNESDLKSGPAVRVFLNGLAAAFGAVVIVFWLPSLVWE